MEQSLGNVNAVRRAAEEVRNKKFGKQYRDLYLEIMEAASSGTFFYETNHDVPVEIRRMLAENGFAVNSIEGGYRISW